MSVSQQRLSMNSYTEINSNVNNSMHFKWLERILMWNFMWIKSSSSSAQSRSLIVNIIGTSLTIIQMLAFILLELFNDGDLPSNGLMNYIFGIVYLFGIMFARLISFYYFFFIYSKSFKQLPNYYDTKQQSLSHELKLFTVSYILVLISHFTFYILTQPQTVVNYIDLISSLFGMIIPLMLSFCVMSVIFLKYELFLNSIHRKIQCTNNYNSFTFADIIKDYRCMYISFQKDYKIWQLFAVSYFLSAFYAIWMFLNYLPLRNNHDIFQEICWLIYISSGIISYLCPTIQFVFTASKLNEQYSKTVELLWTYDDYQNVSNVSNKDVLISMMLNKYNMKSCNNVTDHHILLNIKDYHYILQYMQSHRINVRLMGLEVTKLNAIRFLLMFALAKLISYSIYYYA
eukprot:117858_1